VLDLIRFIGVNASISSVLSYIDDKKIKKIANKTNNYQNIFDLLLFFYLKNL
jgi:hypothetical protein